MKAAPALAVLVAVLAAALALRANAGDRTRIVILPIVVHSAAVDPTYVSRGITDMISSRLEQTGKVQVERVEDPKAATTELGKALDAGKARGGDYLIFGSFTQFGEGASLDVQCLPLDVKNEAEAAAARRIFISSGAMGDLIPKLDEIVDRVAVYTKVARDTAPGPASAANGTSTASTATAATAAAPSADVLRDLTRRLEALEKAVFKDGTGPAPSTAGTAGAASGASTAAQTTPPPES